MLRDGTVIVRSGTQDLGTGTYTVMTQIAAETLGLPVAACDSSWATRRCPRHRSGGSMTAASVGPAVESRAGL